MAVEEPLSDAIRVKDVVARQGAYGAVVLEDVETDNAVYRRFYLARYKLGMFGLYIFELSCRGDAVECFGVEPPRNTPFAFVWASFVVC